MVGYQEFLSLSQSPNSEERGSAAHFSALAYVNHSGPADEHAALYAALIGFLDDPSVKVRAALAYGLLHSSAAPRPIMLALMRDSPVIARAVLQYSPVLIDADLIGLVGATDDAAVLLAVSQREKLSPRLAAALVARREPQLTLRLLRRHDVALGETLLGELCEALGEDAQARGALLARRDLPASGRLYLVQKVATALSECRMVKGSLAAERLGRLLRDSSDTAIASIGEREAVHAAPQYAADLVSSRRLNTRVLLHAVVTGHVMFFADCIAELSQSPRSKVFALLQSGSRPALNALLARCGLGEGVRNLLSRMVLLARSADLADDAGARHYVVTVLTEELVAEHDGVIPHDLEEAFTYLSEQNIVLARKAARGVLAAFAGDTLRHIALNAPLSEPQLALSAA
jgi:uncharacterized protein (DUF2336 family)